MSWFNDMRTMTKLTVSFALMAILLGVVGFLGVSTAGDANAAFETAFKRDISGMELGSHALLERMKISRAYRNGLLAGNQQKRDEALREIDESAATLRRLFDELGPTMFLPENKARLAEARHQLEEYAPLTREAVRVSATDREQANVLLEKASPMGLRIDEALNGIGASKKELAVESYTRSSVQFGKARALVIGVSAFAMALAVVLAFIVGSAIAKPLKATVSVLEQVATGDLTVRVDINRKDEVGQMAAALNRSIE
jgi:methyl-accepting chemotaxis protein